MGERITIDVDQEVFAELQRRAVPLVDSANSVVRRLLGLDRDPVDKESAIPVRAAGNGRAGGRQPKRIRGGGELPPKQRAPKGMLLQSEEYELPILQAIVELKGRVPATEVLDALEPKLRDRLTPLDLEPIASGSIRWKNRAQFARLHLVRSGDMVKGSPRGIWEISDQGMRRVENQRQQRSGAAS